MKFYLMGLGAVRLCGSKGGRDPRVEISEFCLTDNVLRPHAHAISGQGKKIMQTPSDPKRVFIQTDSIQQIAV